MSAKYILDNQGNPVIEHDLLRWARWFENAERRVANNKLPNGVRVSTVFLGLDHNFGNQGPPLIYETMIFGGKEDGYQDRYSTRDEALAGHKKALELATVTV